MLEEQPRTGEVSVKLNEGVSGTGDALVNLRISPTSVTRIVAPQVAQRVGSMQLESATTAMAADEAKFDSGRAVA
jgi:hypothetical protein